MKLIFAYPRAQALADGVLMDVTEMAREAGFEHPTAVTHEVWSRYVVVPLGATGQDEEGRLWDILWMLGGALMRELSTRSERHHAQNDFAETPSIVHYQLAVRNGDDRLEQVTLKAVCGPGDGGEPVITIMCPHED